MKKIFTLLSAVVLGCFGAMATTASWNFSEWEADTLLETTTIDGLTVYANADAAVTIDANNKTISGTKYTKRLKFGGAASWTEEGAPAARLLAFDVDGAVDIKIALTSASSSDTGTGRNLEIYNGSKDNVVGSYEAPAGSIEVQTYKYTGTEATTLYVGVKSGGGVNIYFINVTPAETGGDEPQDPDPVEPGDVATGLILDYESFDFKDNTGTSDGYTLVLNKDGKSYAKGTNITIDGKTYLSIKTSKGAPNILTLPENLVATKITIYSYMNSDPSADTYWTVNGVKNEDKLVSVKDGANPDIRTFNLESVPVIEFEESGTQCGFVLALDVTEASGIESVAAENAVAVYYNLQGVRVDNPVSGNLYIRVAGNKAVKVIK